MKTFSVNQISCEINFGQFRILKTTELAIFLAINLDFGQFGQILFEAKFSKTKIQSFKNCQISRFGDSKFAKIDFT